MIKLNLEVIRQQLANKAKCHSCMMEGYCGGICKVTPASQEDWLDHFKKELKNRD